MEFHTKAIVLFFLSAVMLIDCGSTAGVQSQDVDLRFNRGKERFQNGKYYKSIDDFNFVVLNSPGDERADDAQLFLADAHFEMKEYVVAASEYKRLIQKYPESPLVEQARYKLGLCLVELSPHYLLQQDYTRDAINTLQGFVEDYPYSKYHEEVTKLIGELRGKLAHKMYGSGHLYYVLNQYDAAIIYFDQLLDNYYDTEWANKTRLERARCLYKLERVQEARAQLEDLLDRNPEQEIMREAKRLLNEMPEPVSSVTQAEGLE